MNPRHRFQLAPLLILLIASALRFHALARDVRFHPDEALFANFARSAAVQGDWMLHGSLDKPPVTIYADALSMMFFGVTPLPNAVLTLDVHAGEFAARIPGTFASILLVAVMYALAKQLYRNQSSVVSHQSSENRNFGNRFSLITHHSLLITALLAALSPYALAFSATAFTDGLMLLFLTLSLWSASRGKVVQAGIWLALAFGCKQQALFYAPLALAILWRFQPRVTKHHFLKLITHYSLLIPLLIGVALLFAWDGARGQSTSMWVLAAANNDPGRLARLDELLPRLATWGQFAQYLFGTGLLTTVFFAVALVYAVRQLRQHVFTYHPHVTIDLILFAYVILYFLLNWLIAFNIYDRYLLLLLPPLWLIAARGINEVLKNVFVVGAQCAAPLRKILAPLILCAFVLTLFSFSLQAANGALPIGGDHGENAGIDQLAAYLDSKPLGAIIYDHWLGWELGYYLGTWSDKRRVYYPTPEALVADALLQADPAPRYFAAPDDVIYQPWLDALQAGGFVVTQVYNQPPFVVYELIPPRWVGCVSTAESSSPGQTGSFAGSCG